MTPTGIRELRETCLSIDSVKNDKEKGKCEKMGSFIVFQPLLISSLLPDLAEISSEIPAGVT